MENKNPMVYFSDRFMTIIRDPDPNKPEITYELFKGILDKDLLEGKINEVHYQELLYLIQPKIGMIRYKTKEGKYE